MSEGGDRVSCEKSRRECVKKIYMKRTFFLHTETEKLTMQNQQEFILFQIWNCGNQQLPFLISILEFYNIFFCQIVFIRIAVLFFFPPETHVSFCFW